MFDINVVINMRLVPTLQVFGQANTPLKRWLLDFAFRRKEAEMKSGVVRKDSMWDKLIFKKVQVNMAFCVFPTLQLSSSRFH